MNYSFEVFIVTIYASKRVQGSREVEIDRPHAGRCSLKIKDKSKYYRNGVIERAQEKRDTSKKAAFLKIEVLEFNHRHTQRDTQPVYS